MNYKLSGGRLLSPKRARNKVPSVTKYPRTTTWVLVKVRNKVPWVIKYPRATTCVLVRARNKVAWTKQAFGATSWVLVMLCKLWIWIFDYRKFRYIDILVIEKNMPRICSKDLRWIKLRALILPCILLKFEKLMKMEIKFSINFIEVWLAHYFIL